MRHTISPPCRDLRPYPASFAGFVVALAAALAANLVLAIPVARAEGGAYVQRYLVSDGALPAEHTDANLINAWGIALSSTGMAWVAANGTSVSTVYDGQGNPLPVSAQGVDIPGGRPTGIVTNDGDDFLIPGSEGTPEPSALIFATEAGIISGWNPNVDPAKAIAVVDNAETGAIYKGIALAGNGLGRFLYATDFHGARVDVFDSNFQPVPLPSGAFEDPALPPGFAPFGIQNIQGSLYVTYAKQDKEKEGSIAGPGLGLINVFDADGQLIRRLASRGRLNAPWGMALAPAAFGPLSHHLLVANSGDGRINAYSLVSGEFQGQIRGADKLPIIIDGLRGIRFGNGVQDQPTNTLFFTAGPQAANQGLYGRIEPVETLNTASTHEAETPLIAAAGKTAGTNRAPSYRLPQEPPKAATPPVASQEPPAKEVLPDYE